MYSMKIVYGNFRWKNVGFIFVFKNDLLLINVNNDKMKII